ncbi:MAG: hypothetical protein GPOALKHO_001344 [Sodalis sp.]|nr:MAG: hypothetical protein GPOALKHO_001344 [Sodalis sp.]
MTVLGMAEKPRRLTGMHSSIKVMVPTSSTPAPKPCKVRRKINNIGAYMPMMSRENRWIWQASPFMALARSLDCEAVGKEYLA